MFHSDSGPALLISDYMNISNVCMYCYQAYAQSVNLSASALYTPEFSSMEYLNYGVGVSEASHMLFNYSLFKC